MKSLRSIYDKKRSTIRWMRQMQLKLKLSPVKTKAIQTWTCGRLLLESGAHSGVSAERRVRREGSKTGLRLLFWLCRVHGETSLSLERLHVDLQLLQSTSHCLHAFSFSYLFLTALTALRDFLEMTKRPLSVSSSNKWVEIFCFSPLTLYGPYILESVVHDGFAFIQKGGFPHVKYDNNWNVKG